LPSSVSIKEETAMKVVHAEIEHLNAVGTLFDQYRVFYGQESNFYESRHFILDRMLKDESIILLALDDKNEAAGFVQLYPTFSSVSLEQLWILNDLYVAPSHRRQGIAKELIEEAKQFASSVGSKGLILETARTNTPAQSLYESLGFRKDTDFEHYSLNV
jgi:ribosomal protein S18 acetylase RimI-like enzyme